MPAEAPKSHFEAEKFFDHIAEDYRARSEGRVHNVSSLSFSRRQDIVTRLMLQTPKGGTVLDYGMGPAVFGPPAVEAGLRYVGIDISNKMVELARGMNLPGAEFHIGDLDSLAQFENTADTVLLIGLIDYLDNPAEGLRRLAKCVKPGGRIILSFRNHYSLPRWLRNTCKELWVNLRGAGQSDRDTTAFAAPVLENSFVPERDFLPVLRDAGFTEFSVDYLDCSPVFFNLPLPKPVWNLWKRVDEIVSCPALAAFCASGAFMASGKKQA
jgi:SAM-dependent methyltransferase